MENIISRIDRIATENPDRIAYDYLGRTNTYGELKEKSDALAASNPVGPIFRSTFIHLKIASKSLKKSQGLQPASR